MYALKAFHDGAYFRDLHKKNYLAAFNRDESYNIHNLYFNRNGFLINNESFT